MSWDISLTDRVTGEVLHSDSPHMMRGGTFMLGGTNGTVAEYKRIITVKFIVAIPCSGKTV